MKAVIYARFSSEKQNEASIEGQLRECMGYANFNNIESHRQLHRQGAVCKDGQPPQLSEDD